jgi:hypothetical protein
MNSKYFAKAGPLRFCVGHAIENAETTSRGGTLSRPSEVSMSRNDIQTSITFRHQGSRDEYLNEATPLRRVRNEIRIDRTVHSGTGHGNVPGVPVPLAPLAGFRLPRQMRDLHRPVLASAAQRAPYLAPSTVGAAIGGAMSATAFHIAPFVRVFNKRSESFVQAGPGSAWHRLTAEDEAKRATGHNRETKEPSIGVYVLPPKNGRVKVGFDLWRLSANLKPAILKQLENLWRSEDAPLFSKTALRALDRKVHFSASFVTVVTLPERVAFWTDEFVSVLSNPDSFEPLERRPSDA